jgi:hypothetical protein
VDSIPTVQALHYPGANRLSQRVIAALFPVSYLLEKSHIVYQLSAYLTTNTIAAITTALMIAATITVFLFIILQSSNGKR